MICAKNYETVSKFVKVMPTLWPLFSRTRCSSQFFPTGIRTPDLWQSGMKVKYVTTLPPSSPSLMFHFLRRS